MLHKLNTRLRIDTVAGIVEGMLLVRLVGLLFAARPDNRALNLLFELVAPLVWPWTWLDRLAGQPRFGARLELATLAAMVMIALLYGGWCWYRSWRGRRQGVVDG
jgi:hypothetical protein